MAAAHAIWGSIAFIAGSLGWLAADNRKGGCAGKYE
jgi:hypothetical protein